MPQASSTGRVEGVGRRRVAQGQKAVGQKDSNEKPWLWENPPRQEVGAYPLGKERKAEAGGQE